MGAIWTAIWTAKDSCCQDNDQVDNVPIANKRTVFSNSVCTDVYEGAEPDPEEDAILRVFWKQRCSVETPAQRRRQIHAAIYRVQNFRRVPSKLSKCSYGEVY